MLEPLTFLFSDPKADNRVSVLLQHSGSEFLLCTLSNKGPLQQTLDLNFVEDEEVTFFLTGKGDYSSVISFFIVMSKKSMCIFDWLVKMNSI